MKEKKNSSDTIVATILRNASNPNHLRHNFYNARVLIALRDFEFHSVANWV